MLKNLRLFYCGIYLVVELGQERCDAIMCWYERRKPLYEIILELHYTKEQKTEPFQDQNGRELPDWLKEAAEKEELEKAEKLPMYTTKGMCLNLILNYGFKLLIFMIYVDTFRKTSSYHNDWLMFKQEFACQIIQIKKH